ncbi:hypothetical protein [Belnapia moabensis]|uniref:hypothetical protein n=1 Tax=Belnapia moabensis TaxID=365533 RepID=UPI0012EDFD0E|nr:hypothetical protein [Belnapia moabensis]
MYPADRETKVRNGKHPGKVLCLNGSKESFDIRGSKFFQGEMRSWSDAKEMFVIISTVAAEGQALFCRSHLAHSGHYLRRIKDPKGKCPPGIKRAKLHTLPLDLDSWPNVAGHDPRRDPAAAQAWMLSVLGSEVADVEVVWQWSSSCCWTVPVGQAPRTLDARVWMLLDEALGETGANEMMKRFDLRVRAFYESEHGIRMPKMGNGQVKKLVDPKISDAIQPIYVAAPRLEDGAEDPMAGVPRITLVPGSRGRVSLADLRRNLPSLYQACAAAAEAANAAGEPVARRMPRSRTKTVRIPTQPIPLGPAALEIDALRKLASTKEGAVKWMEGCHNVYQIRVALEQVALIIHRGGLTLGERDECCLRIASSLVAGMPLGRDVAWVRAQVRTLLVLVAGDEWVRTEWEAQGSDASVVDNYVRASRGERGRSWHKDPRYTYGKARLLDEYQPTREEVKGLRLRSLCTDAMRISVEREIEREEAEAAVQAPRDRISYEFEARRRAPEVHRLRAANLSYRAIAEAMREDLSKVMRLAKLSADQVAEVVEMLAEEAAFAEANEGKGGAIADIPADEAEGMVMAVLDRGIVDPIEVVDVTGLPESTVTGILEFLGYLEDERLAA